MKYIAHVRFEHERLKKLYREPRWFARLPGNAGVVRVERITKPSKGDVESTCLCRVVFPNGKAHPDIPPVRIAVRALEMKM